MMMISCQFILTLLAWLPLLGLLLVLGCFFGCLVVITFGLVAVAGSVAVVWLVAFS